VPRGWALLKCAEHWYPPSPSSPSFLLPLPFSSPSSFPLPYDQISGERMGLEMLLSEKDAVTFSRRVGTTLWLVPEEPEEYFNNIKLYALFFFFYSVTYQI
jgi:hypothetical protein